MTELASKLRRQINRHPLISKYFQVATPDEMVPAEFRDSGLHGLRAAQLDAGPTRSTRWDNDEFALDPTRLTVICGAAGFDGTQFKGLLAERSTSSSTRPRATACSCRSTSTTPAATWRTSSRPWPTGPRDRHAARPGWRRGEGGVQGSGEVAGRGRARPAGLPALPRRVPRRPQERHAGGSHARGLLHGLRRRELRVRQARQQDDRRAAGQGPRAGFGKVRDPVSARLSDHGAGPGRHEGDRSRSCASSM